MERFFLQATSDSPEVILDPEQDTFELSGRSLVEDANVFFYPILGWLQEYVKHPNKHTVFKVRMIHFNTVSSKLMLDIFLTLEEITKNGGTVEVQWYHHENDDDMKAAGEDLKEFVDYPFLFCSYS